MFDFFKWIYSAFDNLFSFINNIISSIAEMLELLISVPRIPSLIVGFVPSFIATSCAIVCAIAVIKLVIGWGNQ